MRSPSLNQPYKNVEESYLRGKEKTLARSKKKRTAKLSRLKANIPAVLGSLKSWYEGQKTNGVSLVTSKNQLRDSLNNKG